MLMHGLRRTQNGHFYWITHPLKCKLNYNEFYESSPAMDRIAPVTRSQIKGCDHEHNCDTYIMEVNVFYSWREDEADRLIKNASIQIQKGLRKYFTFGLGLEIARSIIFNGSLVMKRPLAIFSLFTTRLNWNLISFLVGYVGIYRVSFQISNRE